jgi:hypothetical protein
LADSGALGTVRPTSGLADGQIGECGNTGFDWITANAKADKSGIIRRILEAQNYNIV